MTHQFSIHCLDFRTDCLLHLLQAQLQAGKVQAYAEWLGYPKAPFSTEPVQLRSSVQDICTAAQPLQTAAEQWLLSTLLQEPTFTTKRNGMLALVCISNPAA